MTAIKTLKALLSSALLVTAGATLAPTSAFAQSAEQDAALIKHGEYLARAGDCMACHSAAGKKPFAGGLPIVSGLGTIYSTNITPSQRSGIGNYTEQQFADAIRKGVRSDGARLYPAMPYPDYVKISDADVHALYTYFMKGVAPVDEAAPVTSLSLPFNLRWGMALWNFAFTPNKPFAAPDGATEQVRRGAYLVESLGHCGSCHTPRGVAMNEKAFDGSDASFLAGGDLNGWTVPSLRGMAHWTQQDVVDYLQTGRNSKAAVAGEMTSVVYNSTSHMTDSDVNAIAAYLKSLPASATAHAEPVATSASATDATTAKLTAARELTLGERLYVDNCAACHFVNGKGAPRVFPHLDGATVVNAKDPAGLLHVILAGAQTPSTAKAPSVLPMPGFAYRLNDDEVAQLATFVRSGWSNHAPAVTASDAAKARKLAAK
ncbi:Cytochrome c, mono-and diheme variants [Paraburkholderia fungorum]|uniref:Cytochrome c, mono-and diheme variants n=1 Tax=Paraburkholderia fungorum TaxID=134537 RepID=A0A1H1JFX9_9BURK|nr:cytochrome c [Paraburkholderia fungorum]SDR48931.1 Cytochrome c, mono-and diheme variants [Paraburkholderia fungorum]